MFFKRGSTGQTDVLLTLQKISLAKLSNMFSTTILAPEVCWERERKELSLVDKFGVSRKGGTGGIV